MSRAMEERIKENIQIIALNMLEDGTIPLEKIASITKLPLEEVQQLADEQGKSN